MAKAEWEPPRSEKRCGECGKINRRAVTSYRKQYIDSDIDLLLRRESFIYVCPCGNRRKVEWKEEEQRVTFSEPNGDVL